MEVLSKRRDDIAMHCWTAEQLLDAAYVAVESKRMRDAVTVLVYIVQTYPETAEAAKARDKYRTITGEPFPDGMKLKERATNASVSQGALTDQDFAGGEQLARKFRPAKAPETEPVVAKSKSVQPTSRSTNRPDMVETSPERKFGMLEFVDELESELQLGEKTGRMLALVLYATGMILLPVALFLLVFSSAFSNLLIWSLVLFALAPILIGLGQIMLKQFALHRINERLLGLMDKNAR